MTFSCLDQKKLHSPKSSCSTKCQEWRMAIRIIAREKNLRILFSATNCHRWRTVTLMQRHSAKHRVTPVSGWGLQSADSVATLVSRETLCRYALYMLNVSRFTVSQLELHAHSVHIYIYVYTINGLGLFELFRWDLISRMNPWMVVDPSVIVSGTNMSTISGTKKHVKH